MAYRGGHSGGQKVQKVMVQPINLIFRYLQNRSRVQVWLYENVNMRIDGYIIGFDEYMNVVLDEAEEVFMKTKARKTLGRILLKGDNITLIQVTLKRATKRLNYGFIKAVVLFSLLGGMAKMRTPQWETEITQETSFLNHRMLSWTKLTRKDIKVAPVLFNTKQPNGQPAYIVIGTFPNGFTPDSNVEVLFFDVLKVGV